MVPEKKQDLNIFYIGGHGGFLFFHLLLLSGEYACNFDGTTKDDFDLWLMHFKETVYNKQWGPTDEWKKHESWPYNELTLIQKNYNKAKIFFTCNKLHQWESFPGQKVIIYTDIKTELRLSCYKKANLFHKMPFEDKITSIADAKAVLQTTEIIDGKLYRKGMSTILNQFDTKINLQELIKDPENILRNNFDISYNNDQKTHINHWLSLHTKKLLEKTELLHSL